MLIEKQQILIERYAVIPDVQERLMAVVEHATQQAAISESAKISKNLVPGCISQVWIESCMENNLCRFRSDSDSPMVKGLIGILCELYDHCTPEEVVHVEPSIFQAWRFDTMLTPTRLNGLANARNVIRSFALRHVHSDP